MKHPEDLVCSKCEKQYTDYRPENPNKPLLCKDCRPQHITPKPIDKKLSVVAREMYNGELGEGEELIKAIKSRGYNLKAVEAEVERLFGVHEAPSKTYSVRINVDNLNVREGPGVDFPIVRSLIQDREIYNIAEESLDNYEPKRLWGKLESGLGWILLEATSKV